MGVASGQEEADPIAQRVGKRVDFGAQSTAGSPDGLVFAGFFAQALCKGIVKQFVPDFPPPEPESAA